VFSFGFTNNTIPKNANVIKLMSYNVRLFDLYNESFDEAIQQRNEILRFIRYENPDVLCIQEFYHQEKPTKFNTLDSIYQIMSINSFHEQSKYFTHSRQHFGIALFSKYPIIHKGIVGQHKTETEDMNYCIFADILKNKDTIRVYNVHFESIKLESDEYSRKTNSQSRNTSTKLKKVYSKLNNAFKIRASQSKSVRDHIKSSPYKSVICGDFNDTPMSYTYQIFNSFLTDAFRNTSSGFGVTYVGYLPAGRIDYIFHSDNLHSAQFKIQNEEFSDHHAISCLIY
jgi:endonuclease/exonuclease/phosphatase family metal-dependent hydrolase